MINDSWVLSWLFECKLGTGKKKLLSISFEWEPTQRDRLKMLSVRSTLGLWQFRPLSAIAMCLCVHEFIIHRVAKSTIIELQMRKNIVHTILYSRYFSQFLLCSFSVGEADQGNSDQYWWQWKCTNSSKFDNKWTMMRRIQRMNSNRPSEKQSP